MYTACEFCKVHGERRKLLPFGRSRSEATALVVISHEWDVTDERKEDLIAAYPEAHFVGFLACQNIIDVTSAELACGVLLRNTSVGFTKILLPKRLSGGSSAHQVDGVTIGYYDDRFPLATAARDEYRRVVNA